MGRGVVREAGRTEAPLEEGLQRLPSARLTRLGHAGRWRAIRARSSPAPRLERHRPLAVLQTTWRRSRREMKAPMDAYTLRGRLQPALLATLPLAIAVTALFPNGVTGWTALLSVIVACGGAYLLAEFGRDAGKAEGREALCEMGWQADDTPPVARDGPEQAYAGSLPPATRWARPRPDVPECGEREE